VAAPENNTMVGLALQCDERGVRAYNAGPVAEPPAGVHGQSPWWGSGDEAP